jgi:hypothetical protein
MRNKISGLYVQNSYSKTLIPAFIKMIQNKIPTRKFINNTSNKDVIFILDFIIYYNFGFNGLISNNVWQLQEVGDFEAQSFI